MTLPSLEPRQRWWVLALSVLIAIGLGIASPYCLYRYDDHEAMVLRTNRLTGTRVLRFKDAGTNAAIIARMTRETGLSAEEVNLSRDGAKWIAMEDYGAFVERRQRQAELERTREELEAMRAELRRREQDRRWQEISRESDAGFRELQRESERQSQEMQLRLQLQKLESDIHELSRERR
jgi:hypothetical protein